MPANVESMFSVRQMPWHREGTILTDYPGDWNEARKLAGLDWNPSPLPSTTSPASTKTAARTTSRSRTGRP